MMPNPIRTVSGPVDAAQLVGWEQQQLAHLNAQLDAGLSHAEEFKVIGRILKIRAWQRQRAALQARMAARRARVGRGGGL